MTSVPSLSMVKSPLTLKLLVVPPEVRVAPFWMTREVTVTALLGSVGCRVAPVGIVTSSAAAGIAFSTQLPAKAQTVLVAPDQVRVAAQAGEAHRRAKMGTRIVRILCVFITG
jgi:hypothetical protein